MNKILDDKQYEVIRFVDGHAVVLGEPECGKTNILALRVLMAHQIYGVAYENMLCMTSTNRAQHELRKQIRIVAGDVMNELSVNSCQWFCIKFLIDNHLISSDTGIADEEDQDELLMEIANSQQPLSVNVKKKILENAISIFIDSHDIHLEFRKAKCDPEYMEEAQKYVQLKAEKRLIDYDDIQLMTYAALCSINARVYKHTSFKWIQVDEIHRLNEIQTAIIEKLLVKENSTILYWGDKQESITPLVHQQLFDCLAYLRKDSKNVFFNLSENVCSTPCLHNMLVNYAIHQIGVDAELLPKTNNPIEPDGTLVTIDGKYTKRHNGVVSAIARNLSYQSEEQAEKTECPEEVTCILAKSDDEAEELSEQLEMHGIKHVKLARKDSFMSINFKVIYSHFSVVVDDIRYSDWVRILYQTRALATMELAQRFVKKIREIGLSPIDLMDYEEGSYFINFCNSYKNKELVVFDVESTGSDIFKDDILRIVAMKMKDGKFVPGTEFCVSVGGEQQRFMSVQKALELFIRYIGDDDLLTHDATYKIHLLENNIKRHTTGINYEVSELWDTQRMARMLNLYPYKLKLSEALNMCGLETTKSHNEFDNINAIKTLATSCYHKMRERVSIQQSFISHPEVVKIKDRLRANYMPLYKHTASKLYYDTENVENSFDLELKYVYNELINNRYIGTIRMFPYMRNLLCNMFVNDPKHMSFYHQLLNHLYELRILNDGEFFQDNVLTENLFIMTIPKAKEMQFENVIIYNATHEQMSQCDSNHSDNNARILYTAMSRARKRLYITYEKSITPLICQRSEIYSHFKEMDAKKLEAILKLEEIGIRHSKK